MTGSPCVTLVLRSTKTGAGIAGKDFGEIRGLWPETATTFPTADLLQFAFRPEKGLLATKRRAGCSGWKTRQKGRVSPCSSSASIPIAMLIKRNQDALASLHLLALHLPRFDKEHFDYRNS